MEARDDQPRELEPPRMHALNVTLCHDTVTRFRAGAMTNDEEHDLLVELMSAASPVASEVESAT